MPPPRTSSLLPGQSFNAISRLLREGLADEDSRQMRDSLGALSQQIEAAVGARRTHKDPAAIVPEVQALVRGAREHQLFLTGLGSAWHALYEFGAYQRALRELRDALDAWLRALEQRSGREGRLFSQFEQLAWRTLGEALLLIDMYEQDGTQPSEWPRSEPQARPAFLVRLRRWLGH
jgi:hypothetical protein